MNISVTVIQKSRHGMQLSQDCGSRDLRTIHVTGPPKKSVAFSDVRFSGRSTTARRGPRKSLPRVFHVGEQRRLVSGDGAHLGRACQVSDILKR
jgi:hypothetical protein